MATLAYAASYFARGYVAGHGWFGLYGGLVLFESISRFCFPVAVAAGLASGQTAVALGIAAAPLVSLLVVPAVLLRHAGRDRGPAGASEAELERGAASLSLRAGAGFALAVAGIQLAEQTLLNAAVLTVRGTSGAVLARRRLQRAAHHARPAAALPGRPDLAAPPPLGARGDRRAGRVRPDHPDDDARHRGLRGGRARSGCSSSGPWVMEHVLGSDYAYGRVGLAVIALGMGCHLCAGTLNQAALARGRAPAAAVSWLAVAAGFVAWMVVPVVDDPLRAETGYAGAAVLCAGCALDRARLGRRRRCRRRLTRGSGRTFDARGYS